METTKTLSNTNFNEVTKIVPDIEHFGDGDLFICLSKAWSKKEGWMKSTKVMEVEGVGCVVQVTTQQDKNVSEGITFVPGVKISDDRKKLIAISK